MNEQQKFWALDYANEYVKKNNSFDEHKGVEAWSSMLPSLRVQRSTVSVNPTIWLKYP